MRKKIMITVLSTVTLLIAVSFTSCGKSAKHTKETTTAVKTEKITKETKKKEKIEIKILSKYDQIKKLLSKYPKEMTSKEASDQEIVVIENESFDKASKKIWDQFLKDVKDQKDCAIVICQYTVEGDPILQYVSNVDGKFYYVEDSTRDAYGSEKYVQYTYDYYKIYKQDGHYTAILTTNNKLTFDEAQDVRSLKTAIQLLDIKE